MFQSLMNREEETYYWYYYPITDAIQKEDLLDGEAFRHIKGIKVPNNVKFSIQWFEEGGESSGSDMGKGKPPLKGTLKILDISSLTKNIDSPPKEVPLADVQNEGDPIMTAHIDTLTGLEKESTEEKPYAFLCVNHPHLKFRFGMLDHINSYVSRLGLEWVESSDDEDIDDDDDEFDLNE
jgi:hypothetical protein